MGFAFSLLVQIHNVVFNGSEGHKKIMPMIALSMENINTKKKNRNEIIFRDNILFYGQYNNRKNALKQKNQ